MRNEKDCHKEAKEREREGEREEEEKKKKGERDRQKRNFDRNAGQTLKRMTESERKD